MKFNLFVLIVFAGLLRAVEAQEYSMEYLDSLAIDIAAGENRPYIYSGIGNAFFYGTTASNANDGHMGFYTGQEKLWDDFQIYIDGKQLFRGDAKVIYKPYKIIFQWDAKEELRIVPLDVERNYLRFSFKSNSQAKNIKFILTPDNGMFYSDKNDLLACKRIFADKTIFYGLGKLNGNLIDSKVNKQKIELEFIDNKFDIVFLYTEDPSLIIWRLIKEDMERLSNRQKEWLLKEINRSYFHCNNREINKAVNWIKISLAALWSEDGNALWAGLPWFNECWGRDTFISLEGACLVQGNFRSAKNLFETFARWQCPNEDSPDYGRIPNRARGEDLAYNTTDGTPWFIRGIYQYGLYSGDYSLWRKFLIYDAVILRANRGAIRYHCDEEGFMTHEDAETWMDAVGTEGPWTPRGNRAVDIQALWLTQLEASIRMVETIPDAKVPIFDLNLWKETTRKLRKNIPVKFLRKDNQGLYDHLNIDGSPDQQIRPNQLFALTVPLEPLFDEKTKNNIIESVKENLVYPYGIASLSQYDPEFHPYHQYYLYPKDAAYHNGTVWLWLSGAYKSAAKSGWLIAKNEMNLSLHKGAPGTLSELLDAVPTGNDTIPETSGTVSQAWSLAEFLRCFYQDFIGIKPVFNENLQNRWSFCPKIPPEISEFWVRLFLGKSPLILHFTADTDSIKISLKAERIPEKLIIISLFSPEGMINLVVSDSLEHKLFFKRKGDKIFFAENQSYDIFLPEEKASDYLKPYIPPDIKALSLPEYQLLSGSQINAENPQAKTICDLDDPEFDDVGEGNYTYPLEEHYQPGILDLTHFSLKADEKNLYFKLNFRNLVQPGWHPEYGFQLTFVTIAIKTGVSGTKSRTEVGRNSRFILKPDYAADRFINIGGGILVEEASGKILCQYIPWELGYPLGDIEKKEISFALPKEYLPGNPDEWRLTVLVGGQDDHGGAGLGEFRNVEIKPGRWVGGGRGEGKSNVYDILIN